MKYSKNGSLIFLVGQLPPPINGFSKITQEMHLRFKNIFEVITFDLSPRKSLFFAPFQIIKFVFFLLLNRPSAIYLSLSGGKRQWLDILFLIAAHFRHVPIYIHHHSFSYLQSSGKSQLLCLSAVRNAIHIVLCSKMASCLESLYDIPSVNMRIISNAAFIEERPFKPEVEVHISNGLIIGFLSNITIDKGIYEYLSIITAANESGIKIQGVIAGPIHSSLRTALEREFASFSNIKYIGPVYGESKKDFLNSIDLLLFPTRYKNEAQPVTIFEALSFSVPVISFSRGCIPDMLSESFDFVYRITNII